MPRNDIKTILLFNFANNFMKKNGKGKSPDNN